MLTMIPGFLGLLCMVSFPRDIFGHVLNDLDLRLLSFMMCFEGQYS